MRVRSVGGGEHLISGSSRSLASRNGNQCLESPHGVSLSASLPLGSRGLQMLMDDGGLLQLFPGGKALELSHIWMDDAINVRSALGYRIPRRIARRGGAVAPAVALEFSGARDRRR